MGCHYFLALNDCKSIFVSRISVEKHALESSLTSSALMHLIIALVQRSNRFSYNTD